jgi:hypothetical protein
MKLDYGLFSRAPFIPALALLALGPTDSVAQFPGREAVGQFYRITPPIGAQRYFDAVQVERVSRISTLMPPPVQPLPVRTSLVELTGQILELPERQRIFFSAANSGGSLSLFEIDLLTREVRPVLPQLDIGPAYAAHFLVASDASRLYVQWFAPGYPPRTDIYDGPSLQWLGRTSAFRPDERAAGFEHQAPYLWTLDPMNRAVLVDTGSDQIVHVFEVQRYFGPTRGVVADIWRDLVLVRLDVGHDRYQLVDIGSGEIGPPLDLDGYRTAQPRLVLEGRALALIDMERRPYDPSRGWSATAIAIGSGAVYDMQRSGQPVAFQLSVPLEFPVSSFGTNTDPAVPGRLWVHVPTDDDRIDLGWPACARKSPAGDGVSATIEADWDPSGDPFMYRYRVRVAEDSHADIGAVALQIGKETAKTGAPDGWGVDLIKRERWVRWTNGLGPPQQDIAPGSVEAGFVVEANLDTRPGIAEYRIQAAIGLPRGCESDDRFLDNSLDGYTLAPVIVETGIPRKLAQRLGELVENACEIGWIAEDDCPALQSAAEATESADADRSAAVDTFLRMLADARLTDVNANTVLWDAAMAIKEASRL